MEHCRNSTGLIFVFLLYFMAYCWQYCWLSMSILSDILHARPFWQSFHRSCTPHAACIFVVLSYFLHQSAAMFSIAASRSTIPDHKWFSAILFVPASEVVPFAGTYTKQSFCSHFFPPTYRQLCFANLLLFCLVLFVSFAGGSQNNQSQPKRI